MPRSHSNNESAILLASRKAKAFEAELRELSAQQSLTRHTKLEIIGCATLLSKVGITLSNLVSELATDPGAGDDLSPGGDTKTRRAIPTFPADRWRNTPERLTK
jgi:hypothetical protein